MAAALMCQGNGFLGRRDDWDMRALKCASVAVRLARFAIGNGLECN
jgi:hypothetical protein